MEGIILSKIISIAFGATLGLLLASSALAASPQHVRVPSHGSTTYSRAGTTYHITAAAHGFMVTRQTAHGWAAVHVGYQHPGSHGLIYVRNGCIIYIDYDNGAWTGYYYNVC